MNWVQCARHRTDYYDVRLKCDWVVYIVYILECRYFTIYRTLLVNTRTLQLVVIDTQTQKVTVNLISKILVTGHAK